MATIEEIEERAAHIRSADARALHNLAEHLQKAVAELPVESGLAMAFVKRARTIECAARSADIYHGEQELSFWLNHDVNDVLGDRQPNKAAAALLREAAKLIDEPRLVDRVCKVADHLEVWGPLS